VAGSDGGPTELSRSNSGRIRPVDSALRVGQDHGPARRLIEMVSTENILNYQCIDRSLVRVEKIELRRVDLG
jgi:hypothetical protein